MDKLGNRVYLTLPAEDEDGFIEYKWCLTTAKIYKKNKIASQMKWRIRESLDQTALYVLGVHDNGQLTGLSSSDFAGTFIVLMECASKVKIGLALLNYQKLPNSKYWAIIQAYPLPKRSFLDDTDVITIPQITVPDYLQHAFLLLRGTH